MRAAIFFPDVVMCTVVSTIDRRARESVSSVVASSEREARGAIGDAERADTPSCGATDVPCPFSLRANSYFYIAMGKIFVSSLY